MKFSFIQKSLLVLLLLTQFTFKIFPQETIDTSEKNIDALLTQISKYNYGMDRTPLADFELVVKEKLNSAASFYDLESKMLNVLKANASFDGKQFLCRELSLIGTEKSIEQLIEMVKDNKTSDMARYALQRINSENVDRELVEILDDVETNVKVGIINTLGNRKTNIAVDELGALVLDENSAISSSAASALGKIGNVESANTISDLLNKITGTTHNILADSYLLCADNFLIEKNNIEAEKIYSNILDSDNSSIQKEAALKGMILASPENRSSLILKYLKSDEPQLNQVSAQEVRNLKDKSEFEKITNNFDSFNERTKIQVLNSIKELKNPFFHKLVLTNAEKGSETLRVSAIECLQKLAIVDDVEFLTKLSLENNNEISSAARLTLDKVSGKNFDQKIIDLISTSSPEIQVELIRSIGERMTLSAFPSVVKTVSSENQKVRLESYKTLEAISNPNQLDDLLKVFLTIENPAELKRMENTLAKVSLKNENKNERADKFLTAFDKTKNFDKQMSLLRILGSTGDNKALKHIRTSLKSKNEDVQKTAIQSLYNWPNLEPLNDLLEIVKSNLNNTLKTLALRGYINLVKANGQNENAQIIDLYKTALKYSDADNEKIMIISGVGDVQTVEGLNFAKLFLDNNNLRAEAELAILNMVDRVRWENKTEALKGIEKVLENPTSEDIKTKATEIKNRIINM